MAEMNADFLAWNKMLAPNGDRERFSRRTRLGGSSMTMDYFNQYFVTLMKRKLGLTEAVSRGIFGASQSSVSLYYTAWTKLMKLDE